MKFNFKKQRQLRNGKIDKVIPWKDLGQSGAVEFSITLQSTYEW